MKKLIVLILLMLPFVVIAQIQTEYNQKGDEAKERKDYREAMFWYDQGISNCDRYSIRQLTDIWKADETLHVSMRVVMGNCLRCLTEYSQGNDTIAIKQLIDYYSEGIGAAKNEDNANFWRGQLEQIRRPMADTFIPREPKDRMKFLAGYHASLIAPFGIQVGGMGKSIGWYVRFHSNLAFQASPYDCEIKNNQLIIEQFNANDYYRATSKIKETNWMGSAGIMVKAVSNLYLSAGVGYWDRKYAREFVKVNDNGTDMTSSSGWARDKNSSMNGITIDLDGTYVISEKFYVTAGACLMSFKYVYPGVGVGILF